jgi:AcrR family transcriptional regulator
MRDVADEADITQSLLHYYFRKRDDLFDAVFEREVKRFVTQQAKLLGSDQPLPQKMKAVVQGVIDFHIQNPHLAAFVALETHYNNSSTHAEQLRDAFSALDLAALQEEIDARAEADGRPTLDARQFMVNMMSLCLFPFIAAPIFQTIFEMDDDEYRSFMEARKEHVPQLIAAALSGRSVPSAGGA